MRIKFVATGSQDLKKTFISPIYFNLRAYYEFRGKNVDKVTWANTIYNPRLSVNDMFLEIQNDKIDILCLSIFIWNKHILMHLAKLVKEKFPNIVIIAGGPDLDANTNSKFFEQYPMIDYVVYGDGEVAFVKLVDAIVGQTQIDESAVNIVTREKVYPHRIFYDEEYAQKSYWVELSNEVIKDTANFDKANLSICWEMSRGCPYACTFCDWSAGLHHKVKRRKPQWKEEIDFLSTVTSEIRVMDANWGIYKEDIEIHKYAGNKVFFHARNLPKLNKKAAYEIMSIQHMYYPNSQFAVSLQDLNETVLQNIDRPEIPWEEHKKIIFDFVEAHPKIKLIAEFIIGLPGQTVDTWIETLCEIEKTGIENLEENIWVLLPNSPANKKEYQEKYNLKFEEIVLLSKDFNSFEEIQNAIEKGEPGWYKSNVITQTYSATLADIITLLAMLSEYNIMHKIFKEDSNIFAKVFPIIVPNIKKVCAELAEKVYETGIFAAKHNDKVMDISKYFGLRDVRKEFYKKFDPGTTSGAMAMHFH